MGTRTKHARARTGAVEHLESALETDDPTEKNFHLKQALQLLDVASREA
ncbi:MULTISPECIES: hypothetical protein [Halorussus]|nr:MULTISPECIES: hypothetical protein [Halorussus]NHN59434.1 hypothetical protein [Halorussus sp. JP-T4]